MLQLYIMKKMGLPGTVYTPSTISSVKEATLRKQGATLVKCGPDCLSGETTARNVSMVRGCPFTETQDTACSLPSLFYCIGKLANCFDLGSDTRIPTPCTHYIQRILPCQKYSF